MVCDKNDMFICFPIFFKYKLLRGEQPDSFELMGREQQQKKSMQTRVFHFTACQIDRVRICHKHHESMVSSCLMSVQPAAGGVNKN